LQLKEQGRQQLQRVLIADPELSAFYPTCSDEFLLIATDGLWDVLSSQDAVDYVKRLLQELGLLGMFPCYVADVAVIITAVLCAPDRVFASLMKLRMLLFM
jgi:serine/threonine protein phosphatase PrpC